jgi:hypothetical protein
MLVREILKKATHPRRPLADDPEWASFLLGWSAFFLGFSMHADTSPFEFNSRSFFVVHVFVVVYHA